MVKRLLNVLGRKDRAVKAVDEEARKNMVSVRLDSAQSDATRCDVIGSLFFTTGVIKTELGSVTLGVTAGKFYFTPENAHIPASSLAASLTPALNVNQTVSVNTTQSTGLERQDRRNDEMNDTARVKISKDPEGGLERNRKRQDEKTQKTNSAQSGALSYSTTAGCLSASPFGADGIQLDVAAGLGTDNIPAPLSGKIADDRLFSLIRTNDLAGTLSVRFQPLPGSIRVLKGTGTWAKDLSSEKQKLIQRLIGKLVDQDEWDMGHFELLNAKDSTP